MADLLICAASIFLMGKHHPLSDWASTFRDGFSECLTFQRFQQPVRDGPVPAEHGAGCGHPW
jgi:hypothetical protein